VNKEASPPREVPRLQTLCELVYIYLTANLVKVNKESLKFSTGLKSQI
jgi:hypothetical protein